MNTCKMLAIGIGITLSAAFFTNDTYARTQKQTRMAQAKNFGKKTTRIAWHTAKVLAGSLMGYRFVYTYNIDELKTNGFEAFISELKNDLEYTTYLGAATVGSLACVTSGLTGLYEELGLHRIAKKWCNKCSPKK